MAPIGNEKEIQDQTFVISVKTFFAVGAGLISTCSDTGSRLATCI